VGLDNSLHTIDLSPGSLAFTYCQTPFIYRQSPRPAIGVVRADGSIARLEGNIIDRDTSAAIFMRSGAVRRVDVDLSPGL
jgi:hypothetical protein